MSAWYESHEPPHCPTCECGEDVRHISRIADERDALKRELVVTGKNLCDAMDALHKSERELAESKAEAIRLLAAVKQDALRWRFARTRLAISQVQAWSARNPELTVEGYDTEVDKACDDEMAANA